VKTKNESTVYTRMTRFSCFVFYSLPRKAANDIVYRVPFFVIPNRKRKTVIVLHYAATTCLGLLRSYKQLILILFLTAEVFVVVPQNNNQKHNLEEAKIPHCRNAQFNIKHRKCHNMLRIKLKQKICNTASTIVILVLTRTRFARHRLFAALHYMR
jgi:hypothetical protein